MKIYKVPFIRHRQYKEAIQYIANADYSILPEQLLALETGMDYYAIYVKNKYIGTVVILEIGDIAYAHRIHLLNRYYFKQVIEELNKMFKYIIATPDKTTKNIYDKHKIARRL